jgi:hypothetical protein
LGALSFPPDGAPTAPYPFYDRWGDSFNVMTEFVAVTEARSLAVAAFLAAGTPLKNHPWRSAAALISGLPAKAGVGIEVTAEARVPGLSLDDALVVWESAGQEPAFGPSFPFLPSGDGLHWVEAEVQWPDGRRAFAATNFVVDNGFSTVSVAAATPAGAGRPGSSGVFTFRRTGDSSKPLTVHFALSGTAVKWNDYRRPEGDMPESVTIPRGAASSKLAVIVPKGSETRAEKSIILTIAPGSDYNVGAPDCATLTIGANAP